MSLLAITMLTAGATLAPAAGAAPQLPDLVSDPPGQSVAPVRFTDAQGERLLMRFDGFVHNRGAGALEIRGSQRQGQAMSQVVQRVYDSTGSFEDRTRSAGPSILYEPSDGHNHWHLKNAVRYSLWNQVRTAQVAPAQKVGFCLVDSQHVDAQGPAEQVYSVGAIQFCRQGQAAAPDVTMGISAGWRDVYGRALPFQWIDISDVAPGTYWLRADADPDDVVIEANEANEAAFGEFGSTVNGYNATPVNGGSITSSQGASKQIALTSERFDDTWAGSPGAVQYKIVTAPAKGTLDKPVGQWFTGPVRYTPTRNAAGAETFTFAARDSTSAYPRTPRTAAVTLTLQAPATQPSLFCTLFGCRTTTATQAARTMAVSGAPAQTQTGTATPLQASGTGASGTERWSVDGVPGGNDTVGTVNDDGLYRAPETPPPGGSVVVRAVGETGAAAASVIRVVAPPAARPAPG